MVPTLNPHPPVILKIYTPAYSLWNQGQNIEQVASKDNR